MAPMATWRSHSDGSYSYVANAAYDASIEGQVVTDVFKYGVSDGHGGVATSFQTITITGTNDAPTVGGGAVADGRRRIPPGSRVNLLTGAGDVDSGDVLHVANVTGLSAGVTLVGDTLQVDPSNAAFQSPGGGQSRRHRGELQRGRRQWRR